MREKKKRTLELFALLLAALLCFARAHPSTEFIAGLYATGTDHDLPEEDDFAFDEEEDFRTQAVNATSSPASTAGTAGTATTTTATAKPRMVMASSADTFTPGVGNGGEFRVRAEWAGSMSMSTTRIVHDNLATPAEVEDIVSALEGAIADLPQSGYHRLMPNSTRVSARMRGQIRTLEARALATVTRRFGLRPHALEPDGSMFLTRIFGGESAAAHLDAPASYNYSNEHVDRVNIKAFITGRYDDGSYAMTAEPSEPKDYSAVLYLSGGGPPLDGGDLVFVDSDAERAVEPKAGRLVTYTSGPENVHRVEKVRAGTRIAMVMWFTSTMNMSLPCGHMRGEFGENLAAGAGAHQIEEIEGTEEPMEAMEAMEAMDPTQPMEPIHRVELPPTGSPTSPTSFSSAPSDFVAQKPGLSYILNNPGLMAQVTQADPTMRHMLAANPSLREAIGNPALLRQAMEDYEGLRVSPQARAAIDAVAEQQQQQQRRQQQQQQQQQQREQQRREEGGG